MIGKHADKGWILIDAGWMALARDRGTARQRVDQGYGVVCDIEGRPIADLVVIDTNQEHGFVARRGAGAAPELAALQRLVVAPDYRMTA